MAEELKERFTQRADAPILLIGAEGIQHGILDIAIQIDLRLIQRKPSVPHPAGT